MQVNDGRWCQESWETGDPRIRGRVKDLRKRGYHATVSSMGKQVTKYGVLRLTMVHIEPGTNLDTFEVGKCESGL